MLWGWFENAETLKKISQFWAFCSMHDEQFKCRIDLIYFFCYVSDAWLCNLCSVRFSCSFCWFNTGGNRYTYNSTRCQALKQLPSLIHGLKANSLQPSFATSNPKYVVLCLFILFLTNLFVRRFLISLKKKKIGVLVKYVMWSNGHVLYLIVKFVAFYAVSFVEEFIRPYQVKRSATGDVAVKEFRSAFQRKGH